MFYSQFILAKKGPLGTIWIAAHLERKLRKNQVADTDIGVSVDSILFPEVPIALRLSSHLLLGVVRIYSRKVSYLFDDCSEALLKIKQAFRSTAVDLPPEESTAPYHSITLPETFDLDDFELPDNDIFQGNYVDHHVSTREQITLQDTMDGVVYSTSQFGLDERFGDGDTSQVGLDLEEDIFLEKVAAGHDEVPENEAQASVEPLDDPETDASRERGAGSLEDMPFNGTRNKVEDLSGNMEIVDYAQAPSTPRLLEEPNVSSFKEFLACDHLEMEDHNTRELGGMEVKENGPKKLDRNENDATDLCLDDHLNHDTNVYTPAEEHSHLCGDLEINQGGLGEEIIFKAVTTEQSPADEHVSKGGSHKMEDNVASCDNEHIMITVDGINGNCEKSIEKTDGVEFATRNEEPLSNGEAGALAHLRSSETPSALEFVNGEGGGFLVEDAETLNGQFNNKQTSSCKGTLQPCNSHLSQPDQLSSEVGNSVVISDLQSADVVSFSPETLQGEESFLTSGLSVNVQGDACCAIDGVQLEKNQIAVPTSNAEVQTDGEKNDNRIENAICNDNDGNLDRSAGSELPAPEKLLSVPQTSLDKPHDLLVETPDKEVQDDGDETRISGKKRSFAESSLTVQSLNSVESFEVTRSKRTVDSIPDDDDLLSSILVGRKSSVLKMKPTPPAPEAPSAKRSRLASQPSSLKRKVLMDESMVLHGDTIRQQLTNTEDIRRLRKKAPCTCTEILMIQRQFLEEEIFSEPVLTGVSGELIRLHSEAFDLSGIKVCENVVNNIASLEAVNAEYSGRQIVSQDSEMETSGQPVGCRTSDHVDNHVECYDFGSQKHADAIIDTVDHRDSEHEHLAKTSEMEIDRVDAEVSDAMNHSVVSGDILEMASVTVDLSAGLDKTNSTELTQVDTEELAFSRDVSNGIGLDGSGTVDNNAEKLAAGESDFGAGEEFLSKENKFGVSVEIRGDEDADASVLHDGADSLTNVCHGTGDCTILSSGNIDQALEETVNEKNDVHADDGAPCGSFIGIDDKDQTSVQFCSEEFKLNSEHLIEHDEDFKFASMNDGDYTICQFIDQENTADTQNATLDPVAIERDDIHDDRFANDTEFLNVDDDEIGEDDDEGLPNAEDARLLDNSGWSSRTRAVAKYLQNLFDKEAEHGRKVLSMDNLLAGKTRKEASRMFFETLVLKTKDYVHVEQGKPFDSINLKPRAKLMKSDF